MLQKFFNIFIYLFLILLGLLFTAFFIFVPFKLIDSKIRISQIASLESGTWSEHPDEIIKIEINNDKIIGLAEHRDISYIEFVINKESEQSTLAYRELEKLKVQDLDLDYFIKASKTCNGSRLCLDYELEKFIKMPRLILKDNDRKDFILLNLNFKIDPEYNILGKDFLDLFENHYNFYEKTYSFKLFKDEENLLKEFNDYDPEFKDHQVLEYKRYLLRLIRKLWSKSLESMGPEDLAEFMLIDKPLKNKIRMQIDLSSGFPRSATLINPSENMFFNDYCKNFLKNLGPFKNIPTNIRKYNQINIDLILEYSKAAEE